jgi:hypothetical protein
MFAKWSSVRILLTTALLSVALFSMGQSERRLAKEFVAQASKISISVTPPPFLYKYNLKTGILDSISYHNKREKDSILWVHSDFVQHIVDSVFIQDYVKGYTNELKRYGLHVLTKNRSGSDSYTVNVSQIELEEQYYYFSDTAYYGDNVYAYHRFLNALDVSSWFSLHGPSLPEKSGKILFAENLLTDNLDGHFVVDPYTGKIKYPFLLDTLTVKKIYTYAQNLGRTYAGYTFDYLLNTFIDKNVPASRRTKRYWRYDPYRKIFFFALDDRFVPMRNDR